MQKINENRWNRGKLIPEVAGGLGGKELWTQIPRYQGRGEACDNCSFCLLLTIWTFPKNSKNDWKILVGWCTFGFVLSEITEAEGRE
jgi:hypothetical protein